MNERPWLLDGGQTPEQHDDFKAQEEMRADVWREEDRAYVAKAFVTELRRLWRENQREMHNCFLSGNFWSFSALNDRKWNVLIPEFERRGYLMRGPGGESLRHPEKRAV